MRPPALYAVGPVTTRWVLAAAVVALYFLHQDFWFWDRARPLVFGFLPIGFFYHAVYSVAVAALMWALIRFAWPGHLEVEAETPPDPADAADGAAGEAGERP